MGRYNALLRVSAVAASRRAVENRGAWRWFVLRTPAMPDPVGPQRRTLPAAPEFLCLRSAASLRPELVVAVAVVSRIDRHAGRDDLVDAVEQVRAQGDVGGGDEDLKLLHGARADDGRGDAGVLDHKGDRQLDEAHPR